MSLKFIVLACFTLALPVTRVVSAATPAKPNIIFILADDQRADTIHALGNEYIQTPNLDRLAQSGVAFTHAYYMGGMQGAVCVPSRAMLMSGRTLFHVHENLRDQTTWPEMFTKAGYATFITGKWHNGQQSALRSFQQGKTIFFGGMGDPYTRPVQDITSDHKLTPPSPSGKHAVELFADSAIEFINQQKGDKPFLCYIAFNCPHDPRKAPPEYHARYNADKPPVPPNFLPVHPFDNGALKIRDELLAPFPRTPEVVRRHLADYYAYINFMDTHIGRILDALEAGGQFNNTIIVFSTDQGLSIGSHGLFGKQNLYEESVRVPLIIAGPGIPKEKHSDAFCYLLDVFPTLGEIANVAAPEGSEGKSLLSVITGTQPKFRDSIFSAYTDTQRAVRDDRWKLIVYPKVNKTQLFDLKNDPSETKDLAADTEHAAEVERLNVLLRGCQRQLGDTQPLTSNNPIPQEFDYMKDKWDILVFFKK